MSDRFGVAQSRGDRHRSGRQRGDRRHLRALDGSHISAVDQHHGAAVDGERRQHLERGITFDDAEPGKHLRVGQVVPGRRDPPPLSVRGRRILVRQKGCQRHRVGGQRVRNLVVFPRRLGVLAQLPWRQHGEAQVGERDHHDEKGQPSRPQQKRPAPHQLAIPRPASCSSTQSCRPGRAASITVNTSSKSSWVP